MLSQSMQIFIKAKSSALLSALSTALKMWHWSIVSFPAPMQKWCGLEGNYHISLYRWDLKVWVQWWEKISNISKENRISFLPKKAIIMCWNIWFARNECVFNNKKLDPVMTISRAAQSIGEQQQTEVQLEAEFSRSTQHVEPVVQKWNRPRP